MSAHNFLGSSSKRASRFKGWKPLAHLLSCCRDEVHSSRLHISYTLLGANIISSSFKMFGGTFGQTNQPAGGGMFGSSTNTGTQQGGGVFGGLGTSNQQNQQQGGGIFGGLGQNTQNQPQQQAGSILGLGQNTQQQQPQQQTGGIFGLGQNNQQQGGGLFGGSTRPGGLFTNSTQQQPLAQPQQNQLGSSLWQPNSGVSPRMSI